MEFVHLHFPILDWHDQRKKKHNFWVYRHFQFYSHENLSIYRYGFVAGSLCISLSLFMHIYLPGIVCTSNDYTLKTISVSESLYLFIYLFYCKSVYVWVYVCIHNLTFYFLSNFFLPFFIYLSIYLSLSIYIYIFVCMIIINNHRTNWFV